MRWVLETDGVESRSRGPGHTFWGQVDGCVVLKGAPIQTRAIVILARAHIRNKEQVMLCAMTVKGRACSGSTRFDHSGDFFYTHFHTFSPKPRGDTLRKVKCFWIKVLWSSVSPAARTQHQLSANLHERPAAFLPPPTSFKNSALVNLEIREGLRRRRHHTTGNFVALSKVSRHNDEKEACSCLVMCHSMSSKQKHRNVQGKKKTETKFFS